MAKQFETIMALISEQQFDRAKSKIDAVHLSAPMEERHRLTALSGVLEMQRGNTFVGIDLIRRAIKENSEWLPHWYRLGVYLMDAQQWLKAIAAIDELISLSERKGDLYFVDEARFRKIICLNALGRDSEIQSVKNDIPAGTEVFIGDRSYTLDDFK